MLYSITEQDKNLITQTYVEYKYRFTIMKKHQVMDSFESVISIGGYSIDAESDVRRTLSLTIYLPPNEKNIEERINSWMGLDFVFETGVYSIRDNDYIWYPCGTYLLTDGNTSYDATNNSVSISLGDSYVKFNGTRNGQIGGAPNIIIPAVNEDGTRNILRDILTTIVKQEGGIEDYVIDDIGEFYGMAANNEDYEEYRKNNPEWNTLPYDLEFSVGCLVSDEISGVTDLYPNIQKYFDVYNTFCCGMIPSCDNDPITLSNDFLQKILVATNSESATYDIQNIKNVTEVFGMTYDIDRMSETCTSSENVYHIELEDYEKYGASDYIAFTANSDNIENMRFQINELDTIPIYYEYTTDPISPGTIKAGETHVLQYKNIDDVPRFNYLGQYQPHAICVLTNDDDDPVYTKQYFEEKYNCKNIVFRVEPESPFSVQKLGVVLDVKTGDVYDNIKSDSVAIENAIYDNIKTSSWNDIVTIETKFLPWADVHIKVEYQKQQDSEPHQYIIKSISHNLEGAATSSITMYRFHPLYYTYSVA